MEISISPSALEQNPKSSRKRGHKFSQEAALTGIYNEERISSAPDNTNCRNSSSEQNDDNFASHPSEKGGGGRQGRKSAFIFVIFHPQQFIFSVSQDFSLHGISEGKKEKKLSFVDYILFRFEFSFVFTDGLGDEDEILFSLLEALNFWV
jgi:hypothetical protein